MAAFVEFIQQQFATVPNLPNTSLRGKTILITGTTAGLGLEAARLAAQLEPDHLIVTGRTEAKYAPVVSELSAHCKVSGEALDLDSFASIKSFCDRVLSTYPKLDSVVLNAGISQQVFKYTPDGHEAMLQVNVLGTFLIALRLLPKLAESGSTSQPSRLVITASDTHSWIAALPKTGVLHALDSKERSNAAGKSADKGEQALAATSRYPVSKLCEVLLVQEMARHMPSSVVVTTTNPGLCNSDLTRNAEGVTGYVLYVMKALLARTSVQGGRCILAPALLAQPAQTGTYWSTCAPYPVSKYASSAAGIETGKDMLRELLDMLAPIEPRVKTALSL